MLGQLDGDTADTTAAAVDQHLHAVLDRRGFDQRRPRGHRSHHVLRMVAKLAGTKAQAT